MNETNEVEFESVHTYYYSTLEIFYGKNELWVLNLISSITFFWDKILGYLIVIFSFTFIEHSYYLNMEDFVSILNNYLVFILLPL